MLQISLMYLSYFLNIFTASFHLFCFMPLLAGATPQSPGIK